MSGFPIDPGAPGGPDPEVKDPILKAFDFLAKRLDLLGRKLNTLGARIDSLADALEASETRKENPELTEKEQDQFGAYSGCD